MGNQNYVVYAWYKESGEIYWMSKARENSPAITKKRPAGKVQPPDSPELIKILFKSSDEEEVLSKLDYFQYEVGNEIAAPGFGTLKNSIKMSPKALREHSNGRAIPVDVYDLNGQLVGSFDMVADAIRTLKLNDGSAIMCLHGKQYSHHGYVICYRNEPFREREDGKRYWRAQSVWAVHKNGDTKFFENIPEAAEELIGDRSKTAKIWGSFHSPIDSKKTTHGWGFFGEMPENFKNINFKTRGRKLGSKMKTKVLTK